MKRQSQKSLLSMRARSKLRLNALVPMLLAVLALCLPLRVVLAAEPLSKRVLRQIQAIEEEKAMRTPAQNKMDSQFIYALKKKTVGVAIAAAPQLQPDVEILADGRVLVDITATVSGELLAQIKKLGGEVINSFAQYNAIRALVPLTSIESLAERSDVRFIGPAAKVTTKTVVSEGDITHEADKARGMFGSTGEGVKVGVVAAAIDFLEDSQTSGELPMDVKWLEGQRGAGSREGTAMLEIIHDLAPDAKLFFATGQGGQFNMAENIRSLAMMGCKIIVDDLELQDEPPFQDGVIAQAVNEVSNAGVLYFSAAGNSGNKKYGTSGTWEGDFLAGGDVNNPIASHPKRIIGKLHNFGPATYTVYGGCAGCAALARHADLFWADPLKGDPMKGEVNDYDLFALTQDGSNIYGSGTTSQNGTQPPYEHVFLSGNRDRIVIVKLTGAADRFLHLDTGEKGLLTISTAGRVRGHAASGAPNAFSVAATSALRASGKAFTGGAANPVENFSSDGPRRIFFYPDGTPITPGIFSSKGGLLLNKPDITAADQVMTSVPGFSRFGGTSAAAPHAAAIAALLLSQTPGPNSSRLTPPDRVRTALQNTALDIEGGPNPDPNSGFGIVMALKAAAAVGDPHLATFDGLLYDFQATGEFVLAQVDPDFVVQTRQVSGAPTWPNVAVNNAVATRMGNTKVAICLPPDLDVDCVNPELELAQLNIDGEDTELADGESFSTDDGVDVSRTGNVYFITSESGDSVRATVNASWIDVFVGLGHRTAKVRGLLANANGNVNQLETRDGAVLTNPFSFEDFYHRYADSWRVPENESLLSVCCDGNVEPGIPERPFYAKDLDPEVYQRTRAVCMAAGVKAGPLLDACTLDVAVLGNDAAKAFVDARAPIAVGNIILDTTPPVISSVSAFPNVLWPPNHKMAPVAVAVSASDTSSPTVTCKITSVTSNEPLIGPGSGHTAPDWQITGDLSVNLRAERSGTGNGRVYTLAVQCTDASNNSSSARTTVSVPHNR